MSYKALGLIYLHGISNHVQNSSPKKKKKENLTGHVIICCQLIIKKMLPISFLTRFTTSFFLHHFIRHLYKDLIVFVFIINEIVMSCFIFSFIIVCSFGLFVCVFFFFWCEKNNYIIYIEDWIFCQLIHSIFPLASKQNGRH